MYISTVAKSSWRRGTDGRGVKRTMRKLLRMLAPCVVIIALTMLTRTKHENLVLVVLEGARVDDVRALSPSGRIPFLTAAVSSGVGGNLFASRAISGVDGVAGALTGSTDDGAGGGIWVELANRSRRFLLVGVAGTEASDDRGAVVLPGPDPAGGFIGSNLGAVVNLKTFERGTLPWPYSVERLRIKQAVDEVEASGASPWLEIAAGEGPRRGMLRAYQLDDDTVYLSPVYTRFVKAGDRDGDPYVADDPSAVDVSSRLREYLPRHESDLADARVEFAAATLKALPPELVVYVDRTIELARVALVEPTAGKGASAQAPSAIAAENQYVEVDRRIRRLAELAGPKAVVLVVGAHAPLAADNAVGWFSIAAPDGGGEWASASIDELAATIRYLLSLPASLATRAVPAIVATYPTRRAGVTAAAVADPRAIVPLSTTSLRELTPAMADVDRGAVTATSAP